MKPSLHNYLILICFMVASSQKCDLLNYSAKYVVIEDHKDSENTFKGCLNPVSFNNRKISSITITNQSISTIPAHFIEDLQDLNEIEITNSGVHSILPGAFRNLPTLAYIIIKSNNIPSVLRGSFSTIPNIQYLQLDFNGISFIEEQAFHIPDMIWISLSGNPLFEWDQEWFGKLDKLEEIRFANNSLSTVPRGAFSNFPKLHHISLQNNKIRNIEPGAFDPFNYIERLDLRGNRIALLNADSFANPIRIDYFLMTLNHLNFIPQALLSKLYSKFIELRFNPWTCACSTNLEQWARLNNVTMFLEACLQNRLPTCTAFKPTCTEEINPRGTQRILQIFGNLSPEQYVCVHRYLDI